MRTWPALDIGTGSTDLLQAALLDYEVTAIHETDRDVWRVFFATGADRDTAARELPRRFPTFTFTPVDVPDEDWAARSQAALRAVRVGRILVAPPWDVSDAPVTIVIQPSMGFGTGHHATTRLCLAALQELDLRGRRLLDVGTGSGVLALAAGRLGAREIVAIDDDPDAISSARENLALNPGTAVDLRTADVWAGELDPFNVVVANLTGSLLIRAAPRLHDLTAVSGHLVLSGFLQHEETSVRAAYATCALEARAQEDEWVCVTLRRTP